MLTQHSVFDVAREERVDALLKPTLREYGGFVRHNDLSYTVVWGDGGTYFPNLAAVERWARERAPRQPRPDCKSKRCGVKLMVDGTVYRLTADHAREVGINLLYLAADADERNREIAA
jgi:hypothetical protein